MPTSQLQIICLWNSRDIISDSFVRISLSDCLVLGSKVQNIQNNMNAIQYFVFNKNSSKHHYSASHQPPPSGPSPPPAIIWPISWPATRPTCPRPELLCRPAPKIMMARTHSPLASTYTLKCCCDKKIAKKKKRHILAYCWACVVSSFLQTFFFFHPHPFLQTPVYISPNTLSFNRLLSRNIQQFLPLPRQFLFPPPPTQPPTFPLLLCLCYYSMIKFQIFADYSFIIWADHKFSFTCDDY